MASTFIVLKSDSKPKHEFIEYDWQCKVVGRDGSITISGMLLVLISPVLRSVLKDHVSLPPVPIIQLPDFNVNILRLFANFTKHGQVITTEDEVLELSFLTEVLGIKEDEHQSKVEITLVSATTKGAILTMPNKEPSSLAVPDTSTIHSNPVVNNTNINLPDKDNRASPHAIPKYDVIILSDDDADDTEIVLDKQQLQEPVVKKPRLNKGAIRKAHKVTNSVNENCNTKSIPPCVADKTLETLKTQVPVVNDQSMRESLDCRICDKQFSSGYEKVEHACSLKSNDLKYTCNICEKVYGEECIMVAHRLQHMAKQSRVICPYCSKRILPILPFISHLRIHTNETTTIPSLEVNKSSYPLKEMKNNSALDISNVNDVLSVPQCSFSGHTSTLMNQIIPFVNSIPVDKQTTSAMAEDIAPLNLSIPPAEVITPVDGPNFPIEKAISTSAHNGSILTIKPHNCTKCGVRFLKKCRLLAHQQKHKNKSERQCPLCYKMLSTPELNATHISKHLGFSSKKKDGRVCGICDEVTENDEDFLSHRDNHKINYECPICPISSTQLLELLEHVNMHKTELTINRICTVCNHKFQSIGHVLLHKQSHHGKSQLICPLCSRKFKNEAEATRHVNSHMGKVDLKCKFCGMEYMNVFDHACCEKKCSSAADISHQLDNRPVQFDSSNKAITCNICNKMFLNKNKYYLHGQTHRNKSELECPFCCEKFLSFAVALDHVASHNVLVQ